MAFPQILHSGADPMEAGYPDLAVPPPPSLKPGNPFGPFGGEIGVYRRTLR